MVAIDDLADRMQRGGFRFPSNSRGIHLNPYDLLGAAQNKVDFARLAALAGQSIVSAADLDRDTVLELCRFAALLELTEIEAHRPLRGLIAITAFFEASTRTRLSFESAVMRLDGKVLSVPDGKVTGVAKGESLADIGEMFNTYGDVVIMRHPESASIDAIRANLSAPLINAGNGVDEHPTQALLDWFALLKWRPELADPQCPAAKRIHLGVIGTPSSMRAVRSFLRIASLFAPAIDRVTVVSSDPAPFGAELLASLPRDGLRIEVTTAFDEVLPELDVIYMNSIALIDGAYHELGRQYALTPESPLRPGAVIMHPLARRDELSCGLDDTHHNLYFAQAAGAVYLRQAVLICVLGRLSSLPTSVLYLAS